jgi:hypothetical protein
MVPPPEARRELRRIHLPRTRVNKGKEDRVPLQKHRDRCGCGEGHLGSDHNGSQVPLVQGVEQQSSSVLQCPSPGSAQQVPLLLQGFELQHRSPLAQEPPFSRQEKQ